MRKILSSVCPAALLLAQCVLTSCDPQAFSMNVEMRYPSKSGLDIVGKSVAVVYLEEDHEKDSVFNANVANGFASAIEKEYYGGEQVLNIYKIDKNPDGRYDTVDSLANIVMSTGEDVVFLFDAPEFGSMSLTDKTPTATDTAMYYTATLPYKVRLYAFDSMGKVDTVYSWAGSRTLSKTIAADVYTSRSDVSAKVWTMLDKHAENIGEMSANIFKPEWKSEQYTLLYYESSQAWDTASEYAYDFKWKEAIETWMTLVNTNNLKRRSCAEYDIALGCYMLGDNELALKWLDASDSDYPVSLSKGLRKRINARLQK